jgi:hypothetical protein
VRNSGRFEDLESNELNELSSHSNPKKIGRKEMSNNQQKVAFGHEGDHGYGDRDGYRGDHRSF